MIEIIWSMIIVLVVFIQVLLILILFIFKVLIFIKPFVFFSGVVADRVIELIGFLAFHDFRSQKICWKCSSIYIIYATVYLAFFISNKKNGGINLNEGTIKQEPSLLFN